MARAGHGGNLVQVFVDSREHSHMGDPIYPTLFAALLDRVERREKPTPAAIAERCKMFEAAFGPGCKFMPAYEAPSLASRVPPR